MIATTNATPVPGPSLDNLAAAASAITTAAPKKTRSSQLRPIPNPAPTKRISTVPMRINEKITGRNMCAVEWKKQFPNGTTKEFGAYWKALPHEQRKPFDKLASDAKRSKGSTANAANADGGDDHDDSEG
ncbi:hypothetical protein BJ138DRAFT_1124474 [Hygrophoropsis aurantiaca]|uniref:Uncharacterized protein n=1 Tax=Hygrophoropsis aurantiaca TaxID=72124 RepID=A0ACB8AK64_9AGAM|nr:hypothetical protein BJ138DRAFT_1124474 [Hygrophoropsis aurantiaca]